MNIVPLRRGTAGRSQLDRLPRVPTNSGPVRSVGTTFARSGPSGRLPKMFDHALIAHVGPIVGFGLAIRVGLVRWVQALVGPAYFELNGEIFANDGYPPGAIKRILNSCWGCHATMLLHRRSCSDFA